MPGAGKSTLGKALAKQLSLTFVDADAELVKRCGVPIATIFELEGEAGFRDREVQLTAELVTQPNIVLATGGGVVLRAENRIALRAHGTVIYIRAEISDLIARTRRDKKRPLLRGADPAALLTTLFNAREALYQQTAHLVVNSMSTGARQVIANALAALEAHARHPS